MLYAVIMAGGSGTRLWPLSRQDRPKQALKLIGDRTMFQHSIDRLAPLFPPERIFIVTNARMAEVLRAQTPELPAANFIIEPAGRDSAPAAGLAAVHLLRRDPEAVMVMLTADHFIVDTALFRGALAAAESVAREHDAIVTLGIQPTLPDTRFGYIELGPGHELVDGYRVYASAGFREKPDAATAVRFFEGGRHVWNGGMFIWRCARLLAEFEQQMPVSHAALMRIMAALDTPAAADVLQAQWPNVRKVSVDYGVMEHADRVFVIPVEMGWSDIGSWSALIDVLDGDAAGNISAGPLLAHDATGCFVRSERLVALVGLHNLVVVDTPDALLICPRERAEEVKALVARLTADGKTEYL